jgi:phosphatidylglycerophosphate synthase
MDLRKHAPNALSILRIALVPVLLWLAWTGHPTAFLFTFAFSLATDLADGFLARRFRAGTELGAKLDSWGDLATYAVFPLCAWWLFRDQVVSEAMFVIAAVVAYLSPTLVALAKFRRISSYHTRLAKAVAIVMGAGLILFLGFGVPVFFRAAVLFLLVEAIEEIAITAVLQERRTNVPSIFAALRIARGAKSALCVALALLGVTARAQAQALPDLAPGVSDVSVQFDADVDAGDVAEGCASATTHRDLVRLTLTTFNLGDGPEELGNPECPDCLLNPGAICGNPLFECSPAGGHNHAHYQNFLRYEIVDPNNVVAATGGKRSFCLEDGACDKGAHAVHTCDDQGINPHCSDTYPWWLGCQYVDVTDVPDGEYELRVTVDPLQQIAESNENNNVIETPVVIARVPLFDHALGDGALFLKAEHTLRVNADSADKLDFTVPDFDPTQTGATLVVTDVGASQQLSFGLPRAGWRRVGKASDPRAYRYHGEGSELDPCQSVQLSRSGMRLRCSLKSDHERIPLPAKGDLEVELLTGAHRLCVDFGGVTLRNDADLVKRRGAQSGSCDDGG